MADRYVVEIAHRERGTLHVTHHADEGSAKAQYDLQKDTYGETPDTYVVLWDLERAQAVYDTRRDED
jgi:hypothetical protein